MELGHHWTDQKIRVHLFCCVLALLLTHTIWKRAAEAGITASPERLLDTLAELDQIELVYAPAGGGRGHPPPAATSASQARSNSTSSPPSTSTPNR